MEKDPSHRSCVADKNNGRSLLVLCGQYRSTAELGNIICDFDDMYRSMGIRKNLLDKKGDSKDLQAMLIGLLGNPNYKEELSRRFWYRLNPPGRKVYLSYSEVAKCMVALGKRQLAMEIMPSVLLDLTIDTKPKKKRRWLRRAE